MTDELNKHTGNIDFIIQKRLETLKWPLLVIAEDLLRKTTTWFVIQEKSKKVAQTIGIPQQQLPTRNVIEEASVYDTVFSPNPENFRIQASIESNRRKKIEKVLTQELKPLESIIHMFIDWRKQSFLYITESTDPNQRIYKLMNLEDGVAHGWNWILGPLEKIELRKWGKLDYNTETGEIKNKKERQEYRDSVRNIQMISIEYTNQHKQSKNQTSKKLFHHRFFSRNK